MNYFSQIFKLSNCVIGGFKTVFHSRIPSSNPVIYHSYTRKSAEARLGIEKPKRPLTPFFKFMSQIKPALLAENPGISANEAVVWTSKHWKQLDSATKEKMRMEYKKDQEDYKKIKEIYESSLTEKQKEDIKRVKQEMAVSREKKKLKTDAKELGKPKRPMNSYILFMQTKSALMKGLNSKIDLKEMHSKLKQDWLKLPASEKAEYENQAIDLMAKYRKALDKWELKMIALGRTDLVRNRGGRTSGEKKSAQNK